MAFDGHLLPSVAIGCHPLPSVAIRGHLRPSEAISGHQWPSARITCERILRYGEPTLPVCIASSILSSHATLLPDEGGNQLFSGNQSPQRSSVAIRGHQRLSEAIRGHSRALTVESAVVQFGVMQLPRRQHNQIRHFRTRRRGHSERRRRVRRFGTGVA